jgi:hypothetical protein
MRKLRSRKAQSRTVPTVRQNTVLYPVVSLAKGWKLPAREIRQLEIAGEIEFKADATKALQRIAAAWVAHDRVLQSPRPKEFRRRLTKAGKALGRAIALLDFNEGAVDQQLHHWLMNSGFRGTADLLHRADCIIAQGNQLIELMSHIRRVRRCPQTAGDADPRMKTALSFTWPIDLKRRAVELLPTQTNTRNQGTPMSFRKFVHKFYALLPIAKRSRSGWAIFGNPS